MLHAVLMTSFKGNILVSLDKKIESLMSKLLLSFEWVVS